jgi:hypothetical protein
MAEIETLTDEERASLDEIGEGEKALRIIDAQGRRIKELELHVDGLMGRKHPALSNMFVETEALPKWPRGGAGTAPTRLVAEVGLGGSGGARPAPPTFPDEITIGGVSYRRVGTNRYERS